MKKLLIIALLLLAFMLVACDGETPSESVPEVSTHVCDFSGEPEYDEDGHFVTCECGEVSRGEHVMKDIKVNKQPTCVEEGKKNTKCEYCQYREYVTIPILEHTHTKHDEVPATCTKNGVTAYEHCDICDIDIGKDVIPRAHVYENGYCTMCNSHEPIKNSTFVFDNNYGWTYQYQDNGVSEDVTELVIPTRTDEGYSVASVWLFNVCPYNIKRVVISEDIKTIAENAFANRTTLSEVEILSSSLKTIGNAAFYGCDGLKSIELPDSVTTIDWHAFQDCKALESFTVPVGVTKLPWNMLKNCISLQEVTVKGAIGESEASVFEGCISLERVNFENGISVISEKMFANCLSLESFDIPDGVTKIGKEAFLSCNILSSVTIPKSVTLIERDAFNYCYTLKEVQYEGTMSDWEKIDVQNWAFDEYLERIVCTDGVIER